ncbi:YhjD/YihY/BrkB family envelope integrity protein [Lentisalinibacter orientalis]|uniref:YhjD/YihY/BrkB family envelope integrity protein n=1 Tax=Lentisalinibacter orientalis TaxID=2992241 RepID=UPI00386AEDCD
MLDSLIRYLQRFLWSPQFSGLPPVPAFGIAFLRYVWAIVRDLMSGQLTMRAMSLVYTTLLSIVPLLAFSFSVLKGFGIHRELEPQLTEFLAPLGSQGERIVTTLMNLVNDVDGGVLGGVSLAFFIYTAFSMVQKIEESVNYVWHVSNPRSITRRFTEYFSVLLMGPVVLVVALGIIASIRNNALAERLIEIEPFGTAIVAAGQLTPYLLAILALTVLYKLIPNTRVKFRAAFVGGLTAGILWATTSAVFASVFVGAGGRIQVVYASFAIAILALMWLYLNWLILLLGAQIAFYNQNPGFLRLGHRETRLANSLRERLALNVMYLVGAAFRGGSGCRTVRELAKELAIPGIVISQVVTNLEDAGLITSTEQERLVPAREPARIGLQDILDAVREGGDTGSWRPPSWTPAIADLGERIDEALEAVVDERTLSDLLDQLEDRNSQAG